MNRDGKLTRQLAIASLRNSRRKGLTSKEALKALSLELDLGVPAARCIRDYLLRRGLFDVGSK